MADLSIEQLEELLQKKRSAPQPAPSVPKCSFKSTRSPFNGCDKPSATFYGELGYCPEHTRSVQARKAKQVLEERKEVPPPPPEPVPEPTPPKKEEPKEEVPIEEPKPEQSEPEKPSLKRPSVVKKSIRRNKWGNFEDPETNIVFNAKTKAAYGVQDHKSGKVTALKDKHIGLCKKYGWRYNLIKEESESSSDDDLSSESNDEPEPEDEEPEGEDEEEPEGDDGEDGEDGEIEDESDGEEEDESDEEEEDEENSEESE